MERFIAVDTGNFGTKVSEYEKAKNSVRTFSIRTRISEGDFRDDAIEACTVIAEIDGVTYKVGNGARGDGAQLATDKKSEQYKLCLLTALATLASPDEKDEINVAMGLPAKEWAIVSKRMDFKEYMLPEGEYEVKFKKSSTAPVQKKVFTIKSKFAYPESIGPLMADELLYDITPTSIVGVLDIGNLNLNATFWQGMELLQDKSITAELGGSILIQELSQELSGNITYCDEMITANILKSEDRCLPSNGNLTNEQIEQSKQIIKRVLRDHAEKVKRYTRARNWPLDVMKIVAIGGTSKDIESELKEVFGNIVVLQNPTYSNSLGYLRLMCQTLLGEIIPITDTKKEAEAKQKTSEKSKG